MFEQHHWFDLVFRSAGRARDGCRMGKDLSHWTRYHGIRIIHRLSHQCPMPNSGIKISQCWSTRLLYGCSAQRVHGKWKLQIIDFCRFRSKWKFIRGHSAQVFKNAGAYVERVAAFWNSSPYRTILVNSVANTKEHQVIFELDLPKQVNPFVVHTEY